MLRITRHVNGHSTLLKLEGAVREQWLEELNAQATLARGNGSSLKLDLADVTFVDAISAEFLRNLLGDCAEVVSCSGFVAASLGLETP